MKYQLNKRGGKMKRTVLILAGLLAGVAIGLTAGTRAASNLSDTDLLTGVKNLFLQAGWTPPSTVTPPPVSKPTDITGALWTVTGPFNKPGASNSPQDLYITQAQTDPAYTPYMFMQNNGIVFKTPVNGVTTSNSSYPRTELREMKDTSWGEASWSDKSGTNILNVTESIDHEPVVKPEVVSFQIHDDSDDVIQGFLQGNKLYTRYNDDNSLALMDSNYVLGTPFTIQVNASGGHIKVSYNGVQKLDYSKSGSGYYFKAGSYCQSNLSKGDNASAYCQVTIDSISVIHS